MIEGDEKTVEPMSAEEIAKVRRLAEEQGETSWVFPSDAAHWGPREFGRAAVLCARETNRIVAEENAPGDGPARSFPSIPRGSESSRWKSGEPRWREAEGVRRRARSRAVWFPGVSQVVRARDRRACPPMSKPVRGRDC